MQTYIFINVIDIQVRGGTIGELPVVGCAAPPPSEGRVTLSWETSYAVARELKRLHPGVDLEGVTLRQIFDWTLALPGFEDDPGLCNDEILSSIFQDWYEEMLHAGE